MCLGALLSGFERSWDRVLGSALLFYGQSTRFSELPRHVHVTRTPRICAYEFSLSSVAILAQQTQTMFAPPDIESSNHGLRRDSVPKFVR